MFLTSYICHFFLTNNTFQPPTCPHSVLPITKINHIMYKLPNEKRTGNWKVGQVELIPELQPNNPKDPGEGQEPTENEDPA
jgi:hypothetical protein